MCKFFCVPRIGLCDINYYSTQTKNVSLYFIHIQLETKHINFFINPFLREVVKILQNNILNSDDIFGTLFT